MHDDPTGQRATTSVGEVTIKGLVLEADQIQRASIGELRLAVGELQDYIKDMAVLWQALSEKVDDLEKRMRWREMVG